jgi:hypothetical protein
MNLESKIKYKTEHLPSFGLQEKDSIQYTTEFGHLIANFESIVVWTPRIQKI